MIPEILGRAGEPYNHMRDSKNGGTPKSSTLIGFFYYKPSILGYLYFGNTHITVFDAHPETYIAPWE